MKIKTPSPIRVTGWNDNNNTSFSSINYQIDDPLSPASLLSEVTIMDHDLTFTRTTSAMNHAGLNFIEEREEEESSSSGQPLRNEHTIHNAHDDLFIKEESDEEDDHYWPFMKSHQQNQSESTPYHESTPYQESTPYHHADNDDEDSFMISLNQYDHHMNTSWNNHDFNSTLDHHHDLLSNHHDISSSPSSSSSSSSRSFKDDPQEKYSTTCANHHSLSSPTTDKPLTMTTHQESEDDHQEECTDEEVVDSKQDHCSSTFSGKATIIPLNISKKDSSSSWEQVYEEENNSERSIVEEHSSRTLKSNHDDDDDERGGGHEDSLSTQALLSNLHNSESSLLVPTSNHQAHDELEDSNNHHEDEPNLSSLTSFPIIRSKYLAKDFEVVEDIIEVDSRNASSLGVYEKEDFDNSKTHLYHEQQHTNKNYEFHLHGDVPVSSDVSSPTHSVTTHHHSRHRSSSLNKLIVLTPTMKNSQFYFQSAHNKQSSKHSSSSNNHMFVVSSPSHNNQTTPLSSNSSSNHLQTNQIIHPSLISKSKPSKKNSAILSSVNIPSQTSMKQTLVSTTIAHNTSLNVRSSLDQQHSPTFSSKLFLREWDATTQPSTRAKLLYSFVESCQHLSCQELESKLKSYYELIFTRILGYFQLNYLHCNDLSIQIKSLGIFLKRYKPLIDFIEIGGTQILLEILGFHYYKHEVQDKNECLSLLTSIACNGRKFKEVICFDNGISLLKNAILYLPSTESVHSAKTFFLSIFHGNPKYEKDILEMIVNLLSQHSSPFNWKNLNSQISSTNTPRRNTEFMNGTTPRGSSLITHLISPRGSSLVNNNATDSPNSPSSGKKSHWSTIIEVFKSPRGIGVDDFKRSTVFDFTTSPLQQTTNSPQVSPHQNTGSLINLPNNPNLRDTLTLSSQSMLLIYSVIQEISKVVKIERIRETSVIDVLFTNLSDEDIRVVNESVDMILLSMNYQDENEIFAEIILHRVLQGISMITILLGKKRFKNLLKSLFKSDQQHKKQVKHFHHLLFGTCSILNALIEKKSRNIFKRLIDANVVLMLIESMVVIKEKYGENEYHLEGIKVMTMLFRNLILRFEELNMPDADNSPQNILQQVLGVEITQSLCNTNRSTNSALPTNFYLFLQDAIQRSCFEQVRQNITASSRK
ncbi:hypothetical protein C9374_001725 [Naegleria lovaniensis]|uniref:Uncharacterized protein n=1 Tax=Naegleria lovaniensis TaxID=51637 RepID=A0AA88GW35_NAELO|nr:uncharacterized protein C9374_001725 [Naegleria lovaniensis]KAG2387393.1 hypothetical protein C9374_001725 [Naegleria lovaniensis]